MKGISNDVIRAVENLNCDYITALDTMDMNGWLNCFNQQGSYSFIAEENVRRGLPIAFMLDDCYERLQDRVTQVINIQQDSTEHYQTRHFTQLTSVSKQSEDLIQTTFNFSVYYTQRDNNQTQILCVGRYEDIIILEGGNAQFNDRKAVTDTNVLSRYVAYPI